MSTRRLALFCAPFALSCAASAPAMSTTKVADARFQALWSNFLDEYLRHEPVEATGLGAHNHDGEWPDLSEGGQRDARRFRARVRADLVVIPKDTLSPSTAIDAEILMKELDFADYRDETLRPTELNPLLYVRTIGDGIDPLVTRDFAPAPVRARALAQRLHGLRAVLDVARARLTHPARIATETAIRQNRGLSAVCAGGFPELVAQAPEQREAVQNAAKEAAAALKDFQGFLEGELLQRSDGDFRVGKEKHDALIHNYLDANVDGDALAAQARATLTETQEEMAATARELWPELMGAAPLPDTATPEARRALVRQVLGKLAEDRPTNATIVGDAGKLLEGATAFVREHDLVRLPTEPANVIEMPEYRRGVAVAYCDSSGPLERKPETFIAISPTPKDWSPERAQSFYREYDASMLADLMVHEAMPGHYLQGMHANHWKGVARAIFANGAFVEGWAVYSEWLMAKSGFGGPRVKLQRQKMLARVCANVLLDRGIHAGTMDEKQALDLMMTEAFQEEGEAAGKWTRARVTAGQLSSYFYGFTELMKMRAAAEKQPGFTERAYHDKLLSFGAISLSQLRAGMGL
jgi:uncharacterized protein (DUF885 family)